MLENNKPLHQTKPNPKPTQKCQQMQNVYKKAFADATMLF